MSSRPLVALVIGLCVVVGGLVALSAAVHKDDPATTDACVVANRLARDVTNALVVANKDDATAGQLRDQLGPIDADLTALASATGGRYATQIDQLQTSLDDLRQSLTDLGEDTPTDQARPLVNEAADDAGPVFRQLMDDIEPLCAERT
jgi:hypothetical protein